MTSEWITAEEAAKILHCSSRTFLRSFCDVSDPLVTVKDNGLGGIRRRGVRVLRVEIIALSEGTTYRPQG